MGHGRYIDPIPQERTVLSVAAGEHLSLQYVILPGETRELDLVIDLVGEGAEAEVKCLYLSHLKDEVRLRILVHHRSPRCRSRQRVVGIAAGEAQVRFDGKIVVAPEAFQTEAFQENNNILLSETARIETCPALEIYADDVKCSHGATIGQLDAEALFYMRTRGLSEAQARQLQMLSFLSPVIPEGRREEIEHALACL